MKEKRFASWLRVLCLPVAHCFLTILLVSKYTRSVRNWTSLFMPRWRFSTTEKYWCTIFATTSSKASTVTRVSFSILTQTASCWRLKSTISKRTRREKRNCMTQVITPKTTQFTAAQTKRTWAIWQTRWLGCKSPSVFAFGQNCTQFWQRQKHQKIERHKKVGCGERNKARALQRIAARQKTSYRMKWTCSAAKGMRFIRCGWTKSHSALSFKAIRRRKRIDTFADGYRLTAAERYYYLMDLLEAEQR